MTFVLFLLAVIGLSNILVHGKILDLIKVRPWLKKNLDGGWGEIIECYECMGFWAGIICGLLLFSDYWWIMLVAMTFPIIVPVLGSVLVPGATVVFLLLSLLTMFFFLGTVTTGIVLSCGFAGSVLSQTYTDFIYWLRSQVEFEIDEDREA